MKYASNPSVNSGGGGGNADLTDYYTKFIIDSLLRAKVDIDSVFDKSEVNTFLEAKADKNNTFTKEEINAAIQRYIEVLQLKADSSAVYTKEEIDNRMNSSFQHVETTYDLKSIDLSNISTGAIVYNQETEIHYFVSFNGEEKVLNPLTPMSFSIE